MTSQGLLAVEGRGGTRGVLLRVTLISGARIPMLGHLVPTVLLWLHVGIPGAGGIAWGGADRGMGRGRCIGTQSEATDTWAHLQSWIYLV